MFDSDITAETKTELYLELLAALDALTTGEPDPVANMANAASLIGRTLPDLNWAGFYRLIDGELVLGPFMGKPACIRIAMGKGVCGTAAEVQSLLRVDDVHQFPGHIACDAASRSELVAPILHEGRLIGVLDLDSPLIARFDADDDAGCMAIAALLGKRLAGTAP